MFFFFFLVLSMVFTTISRAKGVVQCSCRGLRSYEHFAFEVQIFFALFLPNFECNFFFFLRSPWCLPQSLGLKALFNAVAEA
ncbi:hypothetical protein PRUPE_7G079600 [Prunus persica]|uniref:Secreted protein n=1 Tax=Prunus persica TaxID=3760 RepID=A0A251NAG2_PRUPE|nr:hypothetical protein PRUPE_7G079600 [Prunus persica]